MDDYVELCVKLIDAMNEALENKKLTFVPCSKEFISAVVDAIEQLVKERDAAIHDLDMAVCGQESYPCQYCANYGIAPINVEDVCETCTDCENWEWRGVQE